jgi:signal transduction histidine kinase
MGDNGGIESVDNVEVEEVESLNHLKEIHNQKEKVWIANNKKLLKIIGHDIKSPMSSIISFLNLLKHGIHEFDRSKIENYIDIALQASQATYILLDNLLEWAMTENIEASFKPEIIDFDELLESEIKNLEIFTSSKQIEIHFQTPSSKVVFADNKMVKSILRNLIHNAIKYSHRHGKITITTKNKGEFLEIAIKDDGVGMNSEVIRTVFNSSNNSSTLGTFDESGTGLGLLLCKEFVEIHKCKIWVLSQSGKGSIFKFTLPLTMQTL